VPEWDTAHLHSIDLVDGKASDVYIEGVPEGFEAEDLPAQQDVAVAAQRDNLLLVLQLLMEPSLTELELHELPQGTVYAIAADDRTRSTLQSAGVECLARLVFDKKEFFAREWCTMQSGRLPTKMLVPFANIVFRDGKKMSLEKQDFFLWYDCKAHWTASRKAFEASLAIARQACAAASSVTSPESESIMQQLKNKSEFASGNLAMLLEVRA
jgi:hypothetical protein